ncbi:unnamed protein product [Gadus morhua 'NCC']
MLRPEALRPDPVPQVGIASLTAGPTGLTHFHGNITASGPIEGHQPKAFRYSLCPSDAEQRYLARPS